MSKRERFPPPPTTEWYGKVETQARRRPEWPESGGASVATTEGTWEKEPSLTAKEAVGERLRLFKVALQNQGQKLSLEQLKVMRKEFKDLCSERIKRTGSKAWK